MSRKRVLITGMSGLIGSVVRRHLQDTCELSALNRSDVPGFECHRADIVNLEAIQPAFAGKDVVVHLAAHSGEAPWDVMLPHNVIGTYNVLEASRRAGVQRVIIASSGSTVSGWEKEDPYRSLIAGPPDEMPETWEKLTHRSPVRPSGLYGCTKVWGETLARHFADAEGVSVLCLRIGAVNREDRPLEPRHFSIWCSQRDIAQMVERCIEAPESLRFDIFYAVSDNRWSYRDLEHARQVLGFVPQDRAEDFR